MPVETSKKNNPSLSVIVPTYNRWEEVRITLSSLEKSECNDFELIIIEDGCVDGTTEKCAEEFPLVKIIHGDGNLWWSGAINKGVEFALDRGAGLILWLNDDNRVEPQTLKCLLKAYERTGGRSIICCRVKSTRTAEDEWVGSPPIWHPEHGKWAQPSLMAPIISLSHPPGGRGVLIPSECFRELGLVDQKAFPQYWADHDFHYRAMKAGYSYYLATDAVIWNVPWEEPYNSPEKFSLRWALPYLFSRRSPMNILTIRRLLKRHLQPTEYRRVYYAWVNRVLMWIIMEWAAKRPLIYSSLRIIGRIFVKSGHTTLGH